MTKAPILHVAPRDAAPPAENVLAARRHVDRAHERMRDGRNIEATAELEAALCHVPDNPWAMLNLARHLLSLGRLPDARPHLVSASERTTPDPTPAAIACHLLAQYGGPEWETWLRRCVELVPTYATAREMLGSSLILDGRWEEGWPHFEWGERAIGEETQYPVGKAPGVQFRFQPWEGQPLAGKTVLVAWWAAGWGDNLQFARFIPMLRLMGANVVVECKEGLANLYRRTFPWAWIAAGDGQPLPECDFEARLVALPRLLGVNGPERVPPAPYLKVDPELAGLWGRRLGQDGKFRVGIVWGGTIRMPFDRWRSIPQDQLAPLGEVPGVRWVSLQRDRPDERPPFAITDFTSDIRDWADTAALIANLDLVLAVDTAVCHCAGAIGKPVWTMLRAAPLEWRWGKSGETTPWYGNMRLFRQDKPGEWGPVIERVREELGKVAARR